MELNCKANEKVINEINERVTALEEGGGGGNTTLTVVTGVIDTPMMATPEGHIVDGDNIDTYITSTGRVDSTVMVYIDGATFYIFPGMDKVIATSCSTSNNVATVKHRVVTVLDLYQSEKDFDDCNVTDYIITNG